jgi:[ribosomal protein S5]-alanine N-acetyltransferase
LALPERITSLPVVLRTFVPGDASSVEVLCRDSEVSLTTAMVPHPYPAGAAAEWIAMHEGQRETGSAWTYAITHVDDEKLLGAIELRAAPNAVGELGLWIGRPYWGRGYATLAARALIAMAFLSLDTDALSASHLARNPASGRVLEKCGLTPEREERRPHRGGPEEEFRVWSINRGRWAALRFGR